MPSLLATAHNTDLRHRAHDLRNLFGAIASARHLLDSAPEEPRRSQILAALGDAAERGDALTTSLLAADSGARPERLDLAARLRRLEPLLRTIADGDTRLTLDLGERFAAIRVVPEQFDHIVIELVANACHAFTRPGAIRIRLRAARGRVRLIVADTGAGMSRSDCHALLTRPATDGANGTGFQQVCGFVESLHGRLHLRSTPERGTVIVLDLPSLLRLHR
ncbi:ATP-binding protein [Sphingomonas sp. UNC305MFCol5.2]|uniref:ATP-binding protein n=1 Tax=Sphingomonas sp. UNC305MFCol5.2 TaxID=1449076 RepID=UPI0004A71E04|nr:ATP-binding protein [Sphingomonas sp. UNC305MFCol5.2]